MKTKDGHILIDGDVCWVSCQDPYSEHNVSSNPRKAIYRSSHAINMGWDFELPTLKVDCEVEILGVWKERPSQIKQGDLNV